MQFLHQFGWNTTTRCDPGAQILESLRGDFPICNEGELLEEHRRHAVERCAVFFLYGVERCAPVEGFCWENDGCAMCCRGHVSQDAAEAVEEWWWAADDVLRCETHSVPDLRAVVEDGAVGETGCFGHCGGSRCELDVDDFVGGEVLRG